METKRPIVVILFGWTLILTSLFRLITGVIMILKRGLTLAVMYDWIPILFLIAGIGVLRFKEWGRKLVILVALIKIVINFQSSYMIFSHHFKYLAAFWYYLIFAIVYLLIVISFTRPQVKEQFK